MAKDKQKEKSPVQILEERFARGEISALDFQTALRLLKARKDYFNENETTNTYKKLNIIEREVKKLMKENEKLKEEVKRLKASK